MGVRILQTDKGECCFYCSTTMWAFGPVMESSEEADGFIRWIRTNPQPHRAFRLTNGTDPRDYVDSELEGLYWQFRGEWGPCPNCDSWSSEKERHCLNEEEKG